MRKFHPEAAYFKHLKNVSNAGNYMTKEMAGIFSCHLQKRHPLSDTKKKAFLFS